MPPTVVLGPMTPDEQCAFVEEQVADYAEWLVERGDVPELAAARVRAWVEIEPDVDAAVEGGDQFWTAHDATGATVGWLWVKSTQAGLPPNVAFLYQIQVKAGRRRRGFGTAMLAALERVLAASGRRELRLNVWDTNVPARRLYDRAGYVPVEQLPAKRQLRKRLFGAVD